MTIFSNNTCEYIIKYINTKGMTTYPNIQQVVFTEIFITLFLIWKLIHYNKKIIFCIENKTTLFFTGQNKLLNTEQNVSMFKRR